MQPVVVEACYVATETTSRKTLEPLEMFWVAFETKRVDRTLGICWSRRRPSPGRQAWALMSLLVKAWLWWGRRLGTSQAPRPSLPKRVRHILQLSSKGGQAPPLGFWTLPPAALAGMAPAPTLTSPHHTLSPLPQGHRHLHRAAQLPPCYEQPTRPGRAAALLWSQTAHPRLPEPICLLRSKAGTWPTQNQSSQDDQENQEHPTPSRCIRSTKTNLCRCETFLCCCCC